MADSVATSVFPHYAVIWDIPMGALFFCALQLVTFNSVMVSTASCC
jgi:hypothetical protein